MTLPLQTNGNGTQNVAGIRAKCQAIACMKNKQNKIVKIVINAGGGNPPHYNLICKGRLVQPFFNSFYIF